MIYCDLIINDVPVFYGQVCLHNMPIGNYPYLPFLGYLFFYDTQGQAQDPSSPGLGSRFALYYSAFFAGAPIGAIPIRDVPSQTFSIVLCGQNCTITIYMR